MAKKTSKKAVAKSSKTTAAKGKSTKAVAKKAKVMTKKTSKPAAKAKKVVAKVIAKKPAPKKVIAKPIAKKANPAKKTAPIKKAIIKKTIKPAKKVVVPAKKITANTPTRKLTGKKIAVPAKKVMPTAKKVIAVVAPKKIEAPVKASPKPVQKTKAAVQPMPKSSGPVHIQVAAPKPTKEPEGKFEIEYVMHSAVPVLYEMVSTPSGLSEWFCDDVNVRNGICTFFWDKEAQDAKILKEIPERLIRFQWTDHHDGSYFEFRIEQDEMTNDTSLIVTDFALTNEERVSATLLWDSEIDKLKKKIGSIG